MPTPLLNKAKQFFSVSGARYAFAYLSQEVQGIARDFWKDGHWEEGHEDDWHDAPNVVPQKSFEARIIKAPLNIWAAEPGEISEQLWGIGYVAPADEVFTETLVKPLGLTKDMTVLDLSAGLGGRLMRISEEFGVQVTGLEPDPEIAARGMAIAISTGRSQHVSINAYDPLNLSLNRTFDCILARETIYRVPDKKKFITSIVSHCKPKAQVSFTDYIVNPEMQDQPAIAAWRNFEKGAEPCSLVEMAEFWAQAGMSLRVHDDQTDFYKAEVKRGLMRLAQFMGSGIKPDAITKKAIEKRIMTWAHRMAAIEQGLKFYRFYGLR